MYPKLPPVRQPDRCVCGKWAGPTGRCSRRPTQAWTGCARRGQCACLRRSMPTDRMYSARPTRPWSSELPDASNAFLRIASYASVRLKPARCSRRTKPMAATRPARGRTRRQQRASGIRVLGVLCTAQRARRWRDLRFRWRWRWPGRRRRECRPSTLYTCQRPKARRSGPVRSDAAVHLCTANGKRPSPIVANRQSPWRAPCRTTPCGIRRRAG